MWNKNEILIVAAVRSQTKKSIFIINSQKEKDFGGQKIIHFSQSNTVREIKKLGKKPQLQQKQWKMQTSKMLEHITFAY